MPRTKVTKPCGYCGKSIDTRGLRIHQVTCSENPSNQGETSDIGRIESEHTNGNVRVLLDWYKEGLRDGFQFAGRKAA
jgi:hypothetical protein